MDQPTPEQWSATARRWWTRVCSPDRGSAEARARLRRCRNRVEAFLIPEALDLARRLEPDSHGDGDRFGRALDLARVLSHVRTDDTRHPMRRVGYEHFPSEGSDAKPQELGETRFRRFLLASEGEEQVDAFVRLIHLMDDKANVGELADAYHWWGHPDGHARQRWAYAYYGVADYAPDTSVLTPEEE